MAELFVKSSSHADNVFNKTQALWVVIFHFISKDGKTIKKIIITIDILYNEPRKELVRCYVWRMLYIAQRPGH